MSSSESETEDNDVFEEKSDLHLQLTQEITSFDSLPKKSRGRYEISYRKFMDWCSENKVQEPFSEITLVAYFEKLLTFMKPSSIMSIYSMLRTTLKNKDNVNISGYRELQNFMKEKSKGFKSKKARVLSTRDIQEFLLNAPDDRYLFSKVVLVIGVFGACKRQELRSINSQDVEDTGRSLIIKIRDEVAKTQRSFVVPQMYYELCKKYMNLRPQGHGTGYLPFFLCYREEKCTKQVVGINKLGKIPTQVAKYLKLPNPEEYNSLSFRSITGHVSTQDALSVISDDYSRFLNPSPGYASDRLTVKKKFEPIENSSFLNIPNQQSAVCNNATSIIGLKRPRIASDEPCVVFKNCSTCAVTINNYYN